MSEEKQYPSLPQQGKNLASFTWDMLKYAMQNQEAFFVTDEVYDQRISICKKCDWYDEKQHRCKECGCWLDQKAKISLDSCPIGKWSEDKEGWVKDKFDGIMKDLDNSPESM